MPFETIDESFLIAMLTRNSGFILAASDDTTRQQRLPEDPEP